MSSNSWPWMWMFLEDTIFASYHQIAGKIMDELELSHNTPAKWRNIILQPSLSLTSSLPDLPKRFIQVVNDTSTGTWFVTAQDVGQQESERLGIQCQKMKHF